MKNSITLYKRYKRYFSLLISHFLFQPSQKGFTLIELLVVFAIIGILTGVGMASYASFANGQSVQAASADMVNTLSTAKSRAISQVKPPECAGRTLSGYEVVLTIPGPQYALQVVCGGNTYRMKAQDLPSGVTFATGSATRVFFNVSSGSSTPANLIITGYGKTKTITISTTGNIGTN